jgi:hypothetical protein
LNVALWQLEAALKLGWRRNHMSSAKAKKPNISFIMADDIAWFNVSCYNHGVIGYRTISSSRLLLASVLLVGWGAFLFAPPTWSQANVQGQWQTLSYTMPINPVHAALLNNGKILIVSGSGNVPTNTAFKAALLNLTAGTVTTQSIGWDMFCNGMVVLPDGRVFVVGGTLQYNPFFGSPRTSFFDPTTNSFTDQQSMSDGRWYPTATVLGNGRVMVFGGTNKTGGTNAGVEIYSVGSGFGSSHNAPWNPPLYPRLHLLPNGKVFYSGSTTQSRMFDPSAFTWTNVAVTNYGGTRTYGSSVLLPLTPGTGYKPKVLILGGGNPATATTEVIDLSAATPSWTKGPSMSAQRIEINATLLPNGKVLAIGGSFNDEDTATAALHADLYDPSSNTMSSAGTEAFARLYHSVSLLLPDGRVWVGGGNPARGTYESHMEIYSPAYLFNSNGTLATRPTITSVSTSVVGYGNTFTVQTADALNISTVVLMRNGSVTHAFDMEQRYVGVSFTAGSGQLSVTAPPNGNTAPPGYYMLFLINNAGVPSVAKMIQLSTAAGDNPPKGAITSPSGNVTIPAGATISYAGGGSDTDGTVTGFFWNFDGGTPKTSNVASPGKVTYSAPGTYTTTLTVTDNKGIADPHPPTRTITVTGSPDFSVRESPSLQSVTQGGSLTYTAMISPLNGFTGTTSLSVSGLPTGTTGTFNPTTISGGNGSSKLTVTTGSTTPTGVYTVTVRATSGSLTHTGTATLVVSKSGGTTAINLGSGFSTAAGMQFNGHTALNEGRLQLTDTTTTSEASSAFWTTPVNVQNFNTVFTFQLLNANADGFTFTLQNAGVTALGWPGGGLGYGKFSSATAQILKSVAVKFDLYSNSGEGTNSTGIYVNGVAPTTPATTMTGGINIHNSDVFVVQMTYNGTTLTMTITDTAATSNTFTKSFPINIPSTVGGNTAFVGFTAGTGGQTATQQILAWTYGTNTGTPNFSLGVSPSAQSVAQGSSTTYTTTITALNSFTGTVNLAASGLPTGATAKFNPTSITNAGSSVMTVTTVSTTPVGTYPLTVTATSGALSHTAGTSLTVTQSGGTTATVNFGSGFTATGLQFNGHTKLNATRLQLTDTTSANQAASAFWTTPVNIQSFSNTFTFQLTNPNADGFTFTVQNSAVTALGSPGAGLGYGKFSTLTALIPKSVAVKFDLFSNSGEGTNSTGIYTNGNSPTVPATTLGGGINLHSGDVFQVQMNYDGTTLSITISDLTVPANTFTTSFPINIPATVGANTAFVGFTGGTGGLTATQEILNWKYSTP